MGNKEYVEVEVEIKAETELAYLVDDGSEGDSEFWLPKSQIDEEGMLEVGEIEMITIPEWLANEHDLC